MELMVGLVLGYFTGLLSLYFYNHKQNLAIDIDDIKSGITSLHYKLDAIASEDEHL